MRQSRVVSHSQCQGGSFTYYGGSASLCCRPSQYRLSVSCGVGPSARFRESRTRGRESASYRRGVTPWRQAPVLAY